MARYDLSEAEWLIVEPLLPAVGKGKRRVDNQRVVNSIFFVLRIESPCGMICRPVMAPTRPSTSALIVGPRRASG